MEYLPYAESLEDGLSKINCSFPKLKIENNDCVVIEDSCEAPLFDNDAYSICSSSDDELYGFDTPKKDKHNYILNLMKKIEAEISEETDREKDVIDGIEFLSFASEQELMDYAKAQQDLRASASQSDDGLEILDDGTFSDISSNHAIVPTKTKDITRIKGWRNKHFAGINVCDDSGSSLRNDDDGFGDDFDIKSVQDESSEELESVAASTTSKSGFEGDTSHEQKLKRIDSPIIEDSNAVDNAEGFSFHNSNKSLSSTSLSSRISQTLIASNSTKNKDLDFSFDNFDIKGIFTSDKLSNISEDSEKLLFKKINDPFLSPMIPISRNSKNYLDNKVVYKPRVKQGFLDSIAKKVNAQSDENVQEESIASLIANNKVDRAIRWRVPREKLLSGDIYDVEFSPSADCEDGASGSSLGNVLPETVHKKSLNNEEEPRIVTASVELGNESIAAFRSTTLEHYTTNLDELHIDFPIPKLDASDNVTHDEILLPTQDNIVKLQKRQKSRPPDEIKAKTVAEKRRLLTELSLNQRSKRKQKLSFKLRANNEITNSKRIKRLRGQIVINTEKAKTNPLDKKAQLTKALFNEQGVITYGREKPLKSAISKSLLSFPKSRLSNIVESAENSSTSSKIGMILNIGVFRPLYKEASDNVKKFAFDDDGNITAAYAAFSSSAVQDSRVRPFTVKRILVPAVDDTLKKIMYNSINSRKVVKRKTLKNKPRIAKWEIKLPSELTLFKDAQENLSEETKQFVKHNNIDNDVFNITTEMLNYVELKECFQNLEYEYDPDVPIPVEKENIELSTTKLTNNKRKKTKLQRQIESLGGTFIAVQGEEGNEENLAKHSEENKNCLKESCKMGCVCYYRMLRDEHCGKEACMFFCHCPSSARRQGCEIKSKIWLLPEVLRHHNVSQSKLAPVEREYHQTVIMSKDKKITIETKHKKRERKLPSKYKDEILFGYTKGNALDDNEDDDCLLVSIEDERATKQNCQEYKEPSENSKKRLSSPIVSSAETTLENPTLAHDSIMKIKPCYVKIEQNNTINQMAAELTFTPGVHINTHKYSKSPKKSKTSKGRHRNVARKKTGSSNSHGFDVENSCSRTHGITEDYVLRNYLGKVRTKNFMLYASVSHSDKSLFILPINNNCPIIKEDLVEISDSENEIEEKSPNEEERGFQIKFVRSLPQHLFEEQDKVDQDENAGESNETTDHISLESSRQSPNKIEEVVKSSLPTVGGNKRFVYASLPKTDNECKWWVVELDSEKFTDLVYYSDKRALSFPLIKKAVFDTEYNGRTIKLALNNPQSLFKDKFGAYVVGGHKHLIFFGPYELSESHGLTAIRYDDENFPMKVPFTTKFSMSENFKSLGINMTQMKDGPQSVLRAVNAVWWYSTGKKGTVSNVAESRSAQEKQKFSSLATSHNENCSTYESQQEFTTKSQGIETDLHDTVRVIEDDITIEQDPLKIEPYDDYEDSMFYLSIGENSLDAHKTNTTTIDCRMDVPQTNCQLENTEKVESKETLVIGNISSVETPETCQLTPSINSRSLLKKNVAKISTVKSPVHPEKQSPVIPSKRKGKSNDFTKVKRHRKEDLDKEDIQISSLKKKIENLEEAIKSKKLEMEESQNPENFSEIDFESDSSSFSDEEIYKDIIPEKSDDISLLVKEGSNVRRIVHKGLNIKKYTIMGRTPKSKESTPGILPPNLLLKTPREGPCPEKALFCLTPGIGFIPVVEFDPRAGILVIQDPCNPLLEHLFQDKTQAADWLNQYFLNRFIFKPKFDMQWVIMTGSVVRQLQPLNKDIFKYSARSLTIRPSGLELGQCRSMDFVDWEHQEVSLLEKKITNKSSCKKKEQDVKESRELQDRRNFKESTDLIENRSCSRTDHNNMERMRRSELAEIHNNMERMRRSELAELTANLGKLVFPEECASRLPKIGILTRAVYMCEAQKLIEEELRLKSIELKKKRDKLNEKLKGIFADIVNHEEKKRALELCKHVRCNQYKLPDMSDKYFKAMRDKEMSLVSRCCKGMKFIRSMRPESNLSMKSSSSSGSLGSSHSNDASATATTHDQQPARSTSSNQEPALETSSNQLPTGARSSKQPTEGVLRKSNKLRSITAARPDLQIFPASRGGEVISLIDSDDDDRIIEIESEEEDVIWLPDKEGSQQKDEDVEIVFSNFKEKRPKLKFPKPKRKLPQCSPQRPAFNLETTVGSSVPHDLPTEPRIRRLSMESGPSTLAPAPVAMVLAPALMERHRLAAELENKQSGPEFVAVDELDYEPIYCEFESGCSRTDPVPAKYAAKQKQTAQQFIPIQESSVVNIINPPAQTTTPTLQRSLATPFTGLAQIRLKNMTPIGHINPHDNLSKFRGRPVLVRKSNEGFQISKLPATTRPHLTPLSATPVMITETSGNVKTPENVSLGRDNTVTLYHPVDEISVTKTVQFANLNSVQLDIGASSMLSGPKIRKPKEDGISGSIRILLPKRS